jgi:hypothetical protein
LVFLLKKNDCFFPALFVAQLLVVGVRRLVLLLVVDFFVFFFVADACTGISGSSASCR